MTHAEYASSPEFHNAVSRARWAVIQTGLITSGLALFGVYVLATRVNDLHLMSLYWPAYVPAGPMLVGLIAGSGYILASWWFGVRIGAGMVAGIALLQLVMFLACHYADFETRDLFYRETGQPVAFLAFFDHTTRQLAQDEFAPPPPAPGEPPSPRLGYLIRAAEALLFVSGGLLAALTLVGRPRCELCGGLRRSRVLGAISGPRAADRLKRLEERARLADARGFADELTAGSPTGRAGAAGAARQVVLTRCEVCSAGVIEQAGDDEEAAARDSKPWRIQVAGEFARALFDHQPAAAQPEPHPTDSAV